MAKVAFLFPGQGSQTPGMGTFIFLDPELTQLCERAAEATGVDLRHLLTEADDEELRLTQNAQPALLATGVALAHLLRRRGVEPAAAAGHSIGEYTALCVTGAMPFEEAIRLVVERGRAMAEAAPAGTTGMIAVLGIGAEQVDRALSGVDGAWAANYNTPTQVVVGGTAAALQRAEAPLLEAGARRVLPLNVSAAFHTPLMEPAAARLRSSLDAVEWRAPAVPVVANLTAAEYRDAGRIPSTLEAQLRSPVRWADCVARLSELGCDSFLEVGPKRALSGMMRELVPGAFTGTVGSPEAADQLQLPG